LTEALAPATNIQAPSPQRLSSHTPIPHAPSPQRLSSHTPTPHAPSPQRLSSYTPTLHAPSARRLSPHTSTPRALEPQRPNALAPFARRSFAASAIPAQAPMRPARRSFGAAILALTLAMAGAIPRALADSAAAPAAYFDTTTLDLTRVLPSPSPNQSAATRTDLDEMLAVQQKRSDAQSKRAVADAEATIYRFADALGNPPGFTPNNLPKTEAMIARIIRVHGALIGAAKRAYGRPRPFLLEPKLMPLLEKPTDGAYPSGHSTYARWVALILGDMVPEKRNELITRANEYAYNRVVAGVHYPSDIEAGKLAGTAIVSVLYTVPDFRRDLAAATVELRQALNLPAKPGAVQNAPVATVH
jgi:acid phosphatase (class A)